MEPITFRDLKRMRETSAGWFDGAINHEPHSNSKVREVGDFVYSDTKVSVYSDKVEVVKDDHYVSDVDGLHCYSLRAERETLAEYDSMEAFKASEWWDMTMQAWKDGDPDASFENVVYVNGEEVKNEEYYYEDVIKFQTGCSYRDMFGNLRISAKRYDVSVIVDKVYGGISFEIDGKEFGPYDIEQFKSALGVYDLMQDKGINIDNYSLTVRLKEDE